MDRIDTLRGGVLRQKLSNEVAARKYLAGLSIESIAAQCGVSYGAARNAVLRAGCKLRSRGGRKRKLWCECGKPSITGMGGCEFHFRLRNAAREKARYQTRKCLA